MSSLTSLKTANEARLSEEKRQVDRKRHLLTLMSRYLVNNGYIESAERLQAESGVSLAKFDTADNMDLYMVLQEFEQYYEMKFGRKPVLVRKLTKDDVANPSPPPAAVSRKGSNSSTSAAAGGVPAAAVGGERPPRNVRQPVTKGPSARRMDSGDEADMPRPSADGGLDMGIAGSKITAPAEPTKEDDDHFEQRLLKPLGQFADNAEYRELAAIISRDIYQHNPNVRWADVVELDEAKRLLKEAVVMPIKYPQLFTGLLAPWKGVLLYGPPGTGKTMLAKAVATECRTTFFNISASSIVSKWRGDSEKLVRVLFELARYHAPSTIFIDELDSLMSQRGGPGSGEHEASRRMKTELLIQMDGLSKTTDALVFLLAASNLPWELDVAMLRRLEKRVLVPLPGVGARKLLFMSKLPPSKTSGMNYDRLAELTEGYSGSDIELLCKESAMRPLRRLMDRLEAPGGPPPGSRVELDPVTQDDVETALQTTKPSAKQYIERYNRWESEYGSV